MLERTRRARLRKLLAVGALFLLVLAIVACAPKAEPGETGGGSAEGQGTPPESTQPEVKQPVAEEPTTPKDAAGVWTAEAWKDIYPHEYETYMQNALNDTDGNAADPFFEVRGDMTKMYPMLKVIWAGTGFNTFYNEPNGHNHALADIRVSGRVWDAEKGEFKETAFANCLTCKSADYTALYQQQGNEIFSKPIAEINS
ncbi:MAG: ammonia-forming cytochrome c nitrite reductase subunit c552, partial [Coriobacteriales bacterium]|nr:ammonia-forming cytochrome c nitrite reductase subunit c552 [Coriobacteriales bacterium]